MCYSAQVYAEWRKYQRATGAKMSVKDYFRTFWVDRGRTPKATRPKVPRAMEIEILRDGPEDVAALVAQWDADELVTLQQNLFAQKKRVADGQRTLQTKVTKKALDDVRIGTAKMERLQARIDALRRRTPGPTDSRIFPGYFVPVLVSERGEPVVKPMRYQCRPAGKPAAYDSKYPGTYNARRDNLEGFWKEQFGYTHGLIIADVFYEHVERDGKNEILAFTPRNGEPMYIACLWSHWIDPAGAEPDLLSVAAITDTPEPEVAATGHDRTIINIKPEYVQAWLNPDPNDLRTLYRILDDKQHPYYEHAVDKAA